MENTHGGVLLLEPATLLKVTLLHGCFSCFLNCTNDTKSRNSSLCALFHMEEDTKEDISKCNEAENEFNLIYKKGKDYKDIVQKFKKNNEIGASIARYKEKKKDIKIQRKEERSI